MTAKRFCAWSLSLLAAAMVVCEQANAADASDTPVNPADTYLQRKAQVAAQQEAAYLSTARSLGLPCDHVVSHIGGGPDEQPIIVAVVCEMSDGRRAIYEWVRHAYAPDGKTHVRVATLDQIGNDVDTVSNGYGLAGDWWKDAPTKQAEDSQRRQAQAASASQINTFFLGVLQSKSIRCARVVQVVQYTHLNVVSCELPDVTAITYELYSGPCASNDCTGGNYMRAATPDQVQADIDADSKGRGLAGDWWKH